VFIEVVGGSLFDYTVVEGYPNSLGLIPEGISEIVTPENVEAFVVEILWGEGPETCSSLKSLEQTGCEPSSVVDYYIII